MTALEMYDEVLQFVNKQKTATIYPDEFNILINKIQLGWVLNRYADDDASQKRIEDLRVLRTVDEFTNSGSNLPGGEIFNLPYDPNSNVVTPDNPGGNNGYLIAEAIEFKFLPYGTQCFTGETDYVPADPYIKGDQKYVVSNPFRRPCKEEPYYLERKNNIYVVAGVEVFAKECRISYIRYPRLISVLVPNVSCELPLHAHKEIVDMAVSDYLENIESPRYRTSVMQQGSSIN